MTKIRVSEGGIERNFFSNHTASFCSAKVHLVIVCAFSNSQVSEMIGVAFYHLQVEVPHKVGLPEKKNRCSIST